MSNAKPTARAGKPVVLLTGAGQGIGRATARELGTRGYRLGLIDLHGENLETLVAELTQLGAACASAAADVRDGEMLAAAIRSVEGKVGATEVVVPCAGVGGLSWAMDLDLEGFRRMLEVNVLGVARTIEAVLPGMFARKAGHIVGISSVASFRGLPWMPGYSASKAALTTYLEGLRPALKRRGVRITTLYPGFVRTAMTEGTPFRHPVKMLEPADAARYIARAVERRPRDYTFPFSAALGMGLLRRMPNRLFDYCMDQAGPKALTSEF